MHPIELQCITKRFKAAEKGEEEITILQNLSLSAMIGVFAFQADYARVNSAILRWCEPYDNQGVILSHYVNLDKPMYAYSAYVVATPTIGVWNINYAVGLQGERLTLDLKDPTQPSGQRTLSCNGKPIWIAQLQNTFSLNKGWQIELGGICRSKGYSDVYYIYNSYVSLNAAVQKTLLKDGSLVIRLAGEDLLGQEANNAFGDFGSYKIWQTNIRDTQKITLSVRYRFNSAQSKYKGTGAGSDAKARMQ